MAVLGIVLRRTALDAPAAVLTGAGQGVLEAHAVLIQVRLAAGAVAQGEGGVDVPDARARVYHRDIHKFLPLTQSDLHPALVRLGGPEVGEGIVHKLIDDLGETLEVAGDGTPEFMTIGVVVDGKMGFFHKYRSFLEGRWPCIGKIKHRAGRAYTVFPKGSGGGRHPCPRAPCLSQAKRVYYPCGADAVRCVGGSFTCAGVGEVATPPRCRCFILHIYHSTGKSVVK